MLTFYLLFFTTIQSIAKSAFFEALQQENLNCSVEVDSLCSRDIKKFIKQTENQLSFTNNKYIDPKTAKVQKGINGVGDRGLCWWHNRFTLNAAQIASFNDSEGLLIENDHQAKDVIRAIRQGKIVTLKNFSSLKQFSQKYEILIRRELERWQASELLNGNWKEGLKGLSESNPADISNRMELLFQKFNNQKEPIFQLLQMKGVTSHSWIVVDIQKSGGSQPIYDLEVIDSNYKGTVKLSVSSKYELSTFSILNFKQAELDKKTLDGQNESVSEELVKTFLPQFTKIAEEDLKKTRQSRLEYCLQKGFNNLE